MCLYLPDAFPGDAEVMGSSPIQTGIHTPVRFYVYCDDLEARYQKAMAHRLKIIMPITLQFWGDSVFRVQDPFGYIWDFATTTADRVSDRFKGTFY